MPSNDEGWKEKTNAPNVLYSPQLQEQETNPPQEFAQCFGAWIYFGIGTLKLILKRSDRGGEKRRTSPQKKSIQMYCIWIFE